MGLNTRLFLLSLWMLFLELFLVRWISTEIRIFAYVNNLVLLACFVGVGLGCFFADDEKDTFLKRITTSFIFLALLTAAVRSKPFIGITDLLGGFFDSAIWIQNIVRDKSALIFKCFLGIFLTLVTFLNITMVFFPIGKLLGSLFNRHSNILKAYTFNILGSLCGIWLFCTASVLFWPPWAWFLIAAALGFIFLQKSRKNLIIFTVCVTASFLFIFLPEFKTNTLWTPYQKLNYSKSYHKNVWRGYDVNVNNVGFMSLYDMSYSFIYRNYSLKEAALRNFCQYEIPYMLKPDAKDALIVGSGGGNDTAGAIRKGAAHIDAVEIDPGVYRFGYMLHPEKPYQNKSVHIAIDDARSFLKKTKRKYDVISFGLLDAHTTPSYYNNIRLDHYIYTRESFREAKNLLKDDGIVTVIFAASRKWIGIRLYKILEETFGEEPLSFNVQIPEGMFGLGGVMYIAGPGLKNAKAELEKQPLLNRFMEVQDMSRYFRNASVKVTTDDWPYLYIEKPSIPNMYLCVIASLAFLFILGRGVLFKGGKKIQMHFFFLGAAFMLLEFVNISKSSLLYGATWIVNAYMISAIMILILLANWIVSKIKIGNMAVFYSLLWVSIIGLYLLPLESFNGLPYWAKSTLIAGLMNLPILFAGIIFVTSFRNTPDKSVALGSNLMGACFGGLAESLSFITGLRTLFILILFLYVLAFISAACPKPAR